MEKNIKDKNNESIIDLSIDEKTKNLSKSFFNVKINEKKQIQINKSIKTKKYEIYELLKKRLLKPKDYIISRNTNINHFSNTEKTKNIKKDIKFSKLYEKIEFGSLDYLNINSYRDMTKNQIIINLNKNSLLKSQNFNFRPGFIFGIKKKIKNFHIPKRGNKGLIQKKRINKTLLESLKLKKTETINNNNTNNINKNENEEINKNYFRTEESKRSNLDINFDNYFNLDITKKKLSKDLSMNSKTITPRNKILILDTINKSDKYISSNIKNKIKTKHEISDNRNSNSDIIINEQREDNILKGENNIINLPEKSSLKTIILKCLNENNISKRANSIPNKKRLSKNIITKYNNKYRKSFIAKNNEKLLKNFHKYTSLVKENENNLENSDGDNNNNIFKKNQKIEKDKLIKKNFYKFGSKTISSLINTVNSDQIELNNRLFKIIDRANKKVRKEKQIDKVLEIILDKKLKKKKRIKAKDMFIDAANSKKLLEERNKLRFMMRFADLIKDMNDEIALNYTKYIIESNTKLSNEFNMPGLAEFKRLKKLKYIETQNNIRNRMLNNINAIETKLIINEIEKDNLYTKYENIFKKNKLLKEKNKYINSKSSKEEKVPYHNIEAIINNFDKIKRDKIY